MESAGKYLKEERELRNLPLETVARTTRIREHYLQAIEEDKYELLPAPVYMKSFLTLYAKYLGLNPGDVISRYQSHLNDIQHPKPIETEQPVQPETKPKLETKPEPKKEKPKKEKPREAKPKDDKKVEKKKPFPVVYAVVGLGIVLIVVFSIYSAGNNAAEKPSRTRNSLASTRIPTPPPVEINESSPVRPSPAQIQAPVQASAPGTAPAQAQVTIPVQVQITTPIQKQEAGPAQKQEPSPVQIPVTIPDKVQKPAPVQAPAPVKAPLPAQAPAVPAPAVQAKAETPKVDQARPVKIEEPKIEKPATAVAPAPSAPPSGMIEVIEAGTGADVDKVNGKMAIIGKSSEFIANGGKAYFFTRLKTDTEKKITHVWTCNGKETHRVEMTVKPQVWSVSSYSTLLPSRVGDCKVEARDGDRVLATATIKVNPAPASPEQEKKQ